MTVGEPEPEEAGPAAGVGEEGEESFPAIPPLADALLGPLLDSAGEALRQLSPDTLTPAARRLRSFDRRGLATPTARHQLRGLLEGDEELLGAAAAVLMARPESRRLAAAWDEAAAAGGGGPLAVVDEAAREGRLALLASVLTAALPAGFEFGLGLVVAMAATGEREATAAQIARAATTAQGAAEEARRRAEAARVAAVAELARLDGELRDERRARRQLERSANDAAGSDARRVDLEAALTEARQGLAAAEERSTAAERRAGSAERALSEVERRAVAAERRAAETERRAVTAESAAAETERRAVTAESAAAETERRAVTAESAAPVLAAGASTAAGPPPTGDLDGDALDRVARVAEDLAVALRRLASGPPSRGGPPSGSGSGAGPGAFDAPPRLPPPRRTPVPPPRPGTGIDKPAPARSRPPTRRAPVQVPPGMLHDDPAAVAAMVRTPGLAVIVDGYNVSMLAWPEADAAGQRDRLCDALVEFQLRTRCEVTVVFDGADVPGVRPLRRRGLRVVFSAAGQEADEVVVGEVMFRPAEVPVIVASSDREVRVASEAEGATVLNAGTFLQLIGR